MPIEKFLDLSIAHITAQDRAILAHLTNDRAGEARVIRCAAHQYGYILFIESQAGYEETPGRLAEEAKQARKLGLSTAFMKLLQYARDKKCLLVNLDRDVDADDNLPTFELVDHQRTPGVPMTKQKKPKQRKLVMYCKTCGSTNVRRDADVVWNVSAQCWELAGIQDNATCDDCDGETTIVEKLASAT